jgi:hypothetical protein
MIFCAPPIRRRDLATAAGGDAADIGAVRSFLSQLICVTVLDLVFKVATMPWGRRMGFSKERCLALQQLCHLWPQLAASITSSLCANPKLNLQDLHMLSQLLQRPPLLRRWRPKGNCCDHRPNSRWRCLDARLRYGTRTLGRCPRHHLIFHSKAETEETRFAMNWAVVTCGDSENYSNPRARRAKHGSVRLLTRWQ